MMSRNPASKRSMQRVLSILIHRQHLTYQWPPLITITTYKQIEERKNHGIDNIPSDFLMNNIEWWAPPIAALFSFTDSTNGIPEDWR